MELKHTNSNGEIVLDSKLNPMELLFLKNCEKLISKTKSIQYITFSRRCYDCIENKMIYNFHITNPNDMNQNFYVNKNMILKKQILKFLFQVSVNLFAT